MDAEIVSTLVIAVVGAFVLLAHRKWRDRIHGGELEVTNEDGKLRLSSKQGFVFIDPGTKTLTSSHNKSPVPFGKVTGIDIIWAADRAGWQELIFEGTDVFDLLPSYRDRVNKAALILVCEDRKIPVVAAAQYEVRDFFDFTTPVLHAVLKAFGAYQKIDDFMARRKNQVKSVAGSAGLSLKDLDSGWPVDQN